MIEGSNCGSHVFDFFVGGAAAVFIAVKLIEAVMTALVVIVLVGLFVGLVVALLRARNRGW